MNERLTSLLEKFARFKGIGAVHLQGAPEERVQQVTGILNEFQGVVAEAHAAHVVNQDRMEKRGSWFRNAFVVADPETGDVLIGRMGRRPLPLKIRGQFTAAEMKPDHNLRGLHANNWIPWISSNARYMENRTLAALTGPAETNEV